MNARCDAISVRSGALACSRSPQMCLCARNEKWTACVKCGEASPAKSSNEGAKSMDETRRQLLRAWVTKAASDLRGARILGAVEDAPLDTAIYHCQQAAEKSVKAFLVFKELTPEKTHDIRRLCVVAAV